jgi:hypothetical protein
MGRESGYTDGLAAEVGFWRGRIITDTEITSLYNSGAGKAYANLTTAEKVDLVSYWNLSEASGNRADSHGANTLTDNNTVGSVTNAPANMPGTVANFVAASSQYFSKAANLTGTPPTPFSIAVWVYIPTANPDYAVIADGGDTGADPGRWGLYDVAPGVSFISRGSGTVNVAATYDAWNLVYIEYNAAEVAGVSVNNSALSQGVFIGTRQADTVFRLGSSTIAGGTYFTGKQSSSLLYSRVLTADERTDLYNAGDGLFY